MNQQPLPEPGDKNFPKFVSGKKYRELKGKIQNQRLILRAYETRLNIQERKMERCIARDEQLITLFRDLFSTIMRRGRNFKRRLTVGDIIDWMELYIREELTEKYRVIKEKKIKEALTKEKDLIDDLLNQKR